MFIEAGGVKLWDYSDMPGNFKGIICPQFTLIWTLLGAIYYYFIADKIMNALDWFKVNQSFSFVLGIFFGIIVLDYIYSTKVLVKIRRFAKDNDLVVKYEELKKHIKDIQEKNREKYSFLFPFKQSKTLGEYLNIYKKKKVNNKKVFLLFSKK